MYAVEMIGITKAFKNVKANDNVTFRVKKGSIHSLLGENGAGKTTLMNILYGLYQPDEGEIFIHGEKKEIKNPNVAIECGIGMVHQHFMLVRPMTVVENIMLGLPPAKGIFLDQDTAVRKIRELSQKYNLQVDPTAKINQLSVGEQQRVEIMNAIFRGADILILDEPTAVLTPQESKELFNILAKMKEDGKSIILITHKLEEIISIADEVTVLRDGKFVGSCEVNESITKRDLTQMMVGRDVVFNFAQSDHKPGDVILKLNNVCCNNDKGLQALDNVNLEFRKGEIIGIAGVDGNGQKELCEAITGLRPLTSGKIIYKDRELNKLTPKEIISCGISYIPEDRQKTGLAMNFTLEQNFIIKHFATGKFRKRFLLDANSIRKNAEKLLEEYKVKANSIYDKAKDLSGGNQQKVILAREISCEPELIIASHPTRGLDIGATEYVREKLLEQKNKGAAVILVSADLEEIKQLSDKIVVMYRGRVMGVLDRDADIEEIGLLMAGVNKEGERIEQAS